MADKACCTETAEIANTVNQSHLIELLEARVTELEEQVARYEKVMDENLHVEKLLYEDGRLELSGTHPLGKAVIASLVSIFVSSGAENYFEMNVVHPETGPLAVTIQKQWGKTPGQIAAELKEDLRQLRGL